MRGVARSCLGIAGWKEDFNEAVALSRGYDEFMVAGTLWYTCVTAISYGIVLPDVTALRDTAEALALAEHSGDNLALNLARTARGITLIHSDNPDRDAGYELLTKMREAALNQQYSLTNIPIADSHIARKRASLGDVDGAIQLARNAVEDVSEPGACIWRALATNALVEALLRRGVDRDLKDAQSAIDRLAEVPTEPGFVLHDITLLRLRALLALANGEDATYRDYRDRYRKMSSELGFEGHMAWAEAMD